MKEYLESYNDLISELEAEKSLVDQETAHLISSYESSISALNQTIEASRERSKAAQLRHQEAAQAFYDKHEYSDDILPMLMKMQDDLSAYIISKIEAELATSTLKDLAARWNRQRAQGVISP